MISVYWILASLAVASAQVIYYPPASSNVNNLTYALSGSGAPGIYNSSTTPDSEYGSYNWCNMPHVREREYKWVSLVLHRCSMCWAIVAPDSGPHQRIIHSNMWKSFKDTINAHPTRQTHFLRKIHSGHALALDLPLAPPGNASGFLSSWKDLLTRTYSLNRKRVSPVQWQMFADVANPWTSTVGPGFVDSTYAWHDLCPLDPPS